MTDACRFYDPFALCEGVVSDQPRQIRLRLEPATLKLATELQTLMKEQQRPSSLESVVTTAIEELHAELIGND